MSISSSGKRGSVDTTALAYLVVLAGIATALHIWKLPPALPALQAELGLTLVESGFLLSLVQMAGMTLGLVMGLFAEKIGLRRCLLLGLLVLSVASAAGAVFVDKTLLLVFRAVEGCGFLMVVMPGPALIRRLVAPGQLARLMGVWGTYIPIGAVLSLLGGSWLLSMLNWKVLWLLLSLATLLTALVAWRLLPRDPARLARAERSSALSIVRTTLASESNWLLALCFCVYAGQWIAVIGFLPTIYALAGVSGPVAGVLTALVAGSNAAGCFAAGRLLHRGVSPRKLMTIGYATMIATTFIAFGIGAPVWVQFLMVLLFSTVGGLVPTTLFLLVIRLAPTPETTSTSIGWLQQVSAAGQFAGPPLVAWVATLAGGWQLTWVVTGLAGLLGIAMASRLGARMRAGVAAKG